MNVAKLVASVKEIKRENRGGDVLYIQGGGVCGQGQFEQYTDSPCWHKLLYMPESDVIYSLGKMNHLGAEQLEKYLLTCTYYIKFANSARVLLAYGYTNEFLVYVNYK